MPPTPIVPKLRLRFRGNQRLLLRRLVKVADQVQLLATKYADWIPQPNQGKVPLNEGTRASLAAIRALAITQLAEKVPK